MKPIILITMGDPNGVGPEICVKAIKHIDTSDFFPVIIGSKPILDKASILLNEAISFKEIDNLDLVKVFYQNINTRHLDQCVVLESDFKFQLSDLRPGEICSKAGSAALSYVKTAVDLINDKKAEAMVTAPINKESIEINVPGFQGHTEYIGAMCGDPEPVLTLVHGDNWIVSHVSTHVSLTEACQRCQKERIVKVGVLLNNFIKRFRGIDNPKIGVAGLNPHAGENGLFGREEIEEISPAIARLKSNGLDVHGPIPGDVVFPQMKAKSYDGVIAMYHDQGHVVTKTLGFDLGESRKLNGVNLTLGLNLIRTSVDHGTGFDIAWQNMADEHSLLDAIDVAFRTVK